MGFKDLFLTWWSLDFSPEEEITMTPMLIRLPDLPLMFWEENTLRDIGNMLCHFNDRAKPKGNTCSCARLCGGRYREEPPKGNPNQYG